MRKVKLFKANNRIFLEPPNRLFFEGKYRRCHKGRNGNYYVVFKGKRAYPNMI